MGRGVRFRAGESQGKIQEFICLIFQSQNAYFDASLGPSKF